MFISKSQLQAIQFASPDTTRSLCGLYITNTEVAATDGCRLMVVEHGEAAKVWGGFKPEGRAAPKLPKILSRGSVETTLKAWPKIRKADKTEKHDWAWLSERYLTMLDAQGNQINIPVAWLDGKFPNYSQILPKDSERPFRIGLNARFLGEAIYLTDEKSKMLAIQLLDKDHSALIKGKNWQGQSCKHVIMSMRVEFTAFNKSQLNAADDYRVSFSEIEIDFQDIHKHVKPMDPEDTIQICEKMYLKSDLDHFLVRKK